MSRSQSSECFSVSDMHVIITLDQSSVGWGGVRGREGTPNVTYSRKQGREGVCFYHSLTVGGIIISFYLDCIINSAGL